MNIISRFIRDEEGATAMEYALIAALIGISIVAGAGAVGEALNDHFDRTATAINNAPV